MIGQPASVLLAQHASLFWQARQGVLDGRQFVGKGHTLFDMGATLRGVEAALRRRGLGLVLPHEGVCIDLLNITVQFRDWEAEEAV